MRNAGTSAPVLRRPALSVTGLGAVGAFVVLLVAPGASSRASMPVASVRGLRGVDCISGRDCWAVGSTVNKAGTPVDEALHWNGKKWSQFPTPVPKSGSGGVGLIGVTCVSGSDCWAVGSRSRGDGAILNQVLHFNGKKWSSVSTPDPHVNLAGGLHMNIATTSEQLTRVTCSSSVNCWAVGYTGSLGSSGRNEALHFNGRKWSSARVPNPGGRGSSSFNALRGVSCVRAKDCWAVGTARRGSETTMNQALHFNGRRWSAISISTPGASSSPYLGPIGLNAIACTSATACKAAGDYPNHAGAVLNEAQRWDGKRWSTMPTTDPAGKGKSDFNALSDIVCTSARDCWAVGDTQISMGPSRNQALHFDGKKWSVVATPNPGGTLSDSTHRLGGVSCASVDNCWAVGASEIATKPMGAPNEMLHWDGKKWSSG